MGARKYDCRPQLSPVPSVKDTARMPLRNVGRVDINMVVPDPEQPREWFSEEALESLAQSIREKGQLSAIRVRWSVSAGKWVIIAGERRFQAARRAGLSTIDCYFHEAELTRSEVLEQQLIENCLREDLRPLEEATAFAKLIELNGWTAKQLAQAIRVPQSKVSLALALLRLPPDIREHVQTGALSPRAAYELSKLGSLEVQCKLAMAAVAGGLTHDQTARQVRKHRGKSRRTSQATKQTFIVGSGWKVVVSANKRGTYYDIQAALKDAIEEVEHRIQNNVQMF